MVLCFDIGNTDIDVGVFENDSFSRGFNVSYTKGLTRREYTPDIARQIKENNINPQGVTGCVLCSVVKSTTVGVQQALKEIFGCEPVLFENDETTGIVIKTDNPAEVGLDIIAGCMAAKSRYSLPAIVIDMGTATSVTAMNEKGELLGVSIITGVMTSLMALHNRTGLPVDRSLTPPSHAIGTNTPDSIASGIVLGSAYMMDGMIKAFEKEMGTVCNVYATGGLSKIIMPLCEKECMVNENMLLEGLYRYYKAKTGLE